MIASTLPASISRSTVRLSPWMMVFSWIIALASLVGSAPEVQGAGDDAFVFDPPTDLDVQGQLHGHLEPVRGVVVLAHRVLSHLLQEGLVLLAELDVAVLDEGLQRLDAGVFILGAVDLLNGKVFASLRRPLPHDLGKIVLKLNRFDAELVEGLLVLTPEPPGVVQGVVDDLVRLPLRYVGDHDVEVARGGVLRDADDRRGVALAVLPQGGVVRPHEDEPRLGEVRDGFPVVVIVVEPLLGEGAVLGVDGLVLDFGGEGRLALGYSHNHEGIVGELLLPQDRRTFQHLVLVGLEERLRVLLVGRVLEAV